MPNVEHYWDTCRDPKWRSFSNLRRERPDLIKPAEAARSEYERLEHLHDWAAKTDTLAHENVFKLEADKQLFPRLPQSAQTSVSSSFISGLTQDFTKNILGEVHSGLSAGLRIVDLIGASQAAWDAARNDQFWKLPDDHPNKYRTALSLTLQTQAESLSHQFHTPIPETKVSLWNNFRDFKAAADNFCKFVDIERTLDPGWKAPASYPSFWATERR